MAKIENSKMAVGKLREYLQSTKGSRTPIENRIKSENNYLKNMYFKMLCMVQGYDSDGTEEQTLFLQRLVAGCSAEYDLLTYMRQGREISPEDYEEFVGQIKTKGFQYNFLLEALLIAGLGSGNEEMIAFVAELCESMNIDEAEMKFFAKISTVLLQQNFPSCVLLECNRPERIPTDIWKPYLHITDNKIYYENTESKWNLIAPKSKGLNFSEYGKVERIYPSFPQGVDSCSIPWITISGETACLYNIEARLDFGLYFRDFDRIDLINCKFTSDATRNDTNGPTLLFTDCKAVNIKNCMFENFHGRTIYTLRTDHIKIDHSQFRDCHMHYYKSGGNWTEIGGVIYGVPEYGLLTLQNCYFYACGGSNDYKYYRSSAISNCQTEIFNCTFEKCAHYHDTNNIDPSSSNRCLFQHIVSESGNNLISSVELGLH